MRHSAKMCFIRAVFFLRRIHSICSIPIVRLELKIDFDVPECMYKIYVSHYLFNLYVLCP